MSTCFCKMKVTYLKILVDNLKIDCDLTLIKPNSTQPSSAPSFAPELFLLGPHTVCVIVLTQIHEPKYTNTDKQTIHHCANALTQTAHSDKHKGYFRLHFSTNLPSFFFFVFCFALDDDKLLHPPIVRKTWSSSRQGRLARD